MRTIIPALGVLSLMSALDAAGAFLAWTYVLAYILAVAAGLILFLMHRTVLSRKLAIAVVMILASPEVVRRLPLTDRKKFYLAGKSIHAGMTASEVATRMATFDSHPFRGEPHSLSYRFSSSPNTADVIIVRFTRDERAVEKVEYSPD